MPPFPRILGALGLDQAALLAETVTIPVAGLLRLLGEALRQVEVDESWYAERYPDVHAAILAGDTPSAAAHFRLAGYREGRLPRKPAFDAAYYFDRYKDLAGAFDRTDASGLLYHYETQGYFEGRAGIPEHSSAAELWRRGLDG